MACSKASLSPVQSISPLPFLSRVQSLTSVTAWAGRKQHGDFLFPHPLWGVVLSPAPGRWSSAQAAKGVSIQQAQAWHHTGFLLLCWQCKVLLPSQCPAELSEASSRRSLAKSLVRLTRELLDRRETVLSHHASEVCVGLQHTDGGFSCCSVIQPWILPDVRLLGMPEGHQWSHSDLLGPISTSKLRNMLSVLPRQQNGGGKRGSLGELRCSLWFQWDVGLHCPVHAHPIPAAQPRTGALAFMEEGPPRWKNRCQPCAC